MKTGRHFTVYGRVQGVGFRYQTFYWAKRHDVTGFVRNRQDGSVEIEAYGDESMRRDDRVDGSGRAAGGESHGYSRNPL